MKKDEWVITIIGVIICLCVMFAVIDSLEIQKTETVAPQIQKCDCKRECKVEPI